MSTFFKNLYYSLVRFFWGKPQYRRLFVAFDVPRLSYVVKSSKKIQEKVNAIVRDFGGYFQAEPHLHITLVFIGETDETKFIAVKKALKRAQQEFLNMYHASEDSLQSIAHISYNGHIELLGSAVVLRLQPNEQMESLYKIIETSLQNHGIQFKNTQEFLAHTTLGRIVPPKLVQNTKIKQNLDEEIANISLDSDMKSIHVAVHSDQAIINLVKEAVKEDTFSAHSFKLYQSLNGHYIELAHYPLQ